MGKQVKMASNVAIAISADLIWGYPVHKGLPIDPNDPRHVQIKITTKLMNFSDALWGEVGSDDNRAKRRIEWNKMRSVGFPSNNPSKFIFMLPIRSFAKEEDI